MDLSKNISDGKEKRKLIALSLMLLFIGDINFIFVTSYSYALAEVLAANGLFRFTINICILL